MIVEYSRELEYLRGVPRVVDSDDLPLIAGLDPHGVVADLSVYWRPYSCDDVNRFPFFHGTTTRLAALQDLSETEHPALTRTHGRGCHHHKPHSGTLARPSHDRVPKRVDPGRSRPQTFDFKGVGYY